MPVRSTRVWGPSKFTDTNYHSVYTVPSDRTLILRTVTFYNASGTTNPFILACNGGDIDHVVWRKQVVSARTGIAAIQNGTELGIAQDVLEDVMVFNPGDVLYVQGSGQPYVSAGFGTLLDGAPT